MLKNWKTLKIEGRGIKWRAVDEILLTSLEHVPALVLDGASICLRMARFLPGVVAEGYKVSDHLHDIIHIQFVLAGRFRFKTDKCSILLKAGDGIIIPAGQLHSWSCARSSM